MSENDKALSGEFSFIMPLKTFTVQLTGERSLLRVLKDNLMSRDIDWSYDIDANLGKVFVGGFRKVGEFKRHTETQPPRTEERDE